MAIVLADNTPRIEYTVAQGVTQTVFPIPFVFFNKEDSSNVDVKVFVDGVERTLGSISTTTFSITSGGNGAKGSLSTTVTGASGGSTVIVLRDTKIGRTTDFPSGGAFEVSKLNTELDTLVAIEGDFEDHVSRSIRLQDKDTAVSLALPLKADRLGKQLGFNATTGAVQMFTPESLAIASDSGSSSVDLTSNTFTFTGGEGIDTSISNQTLTITGELASTSNKGVASFNSTNFTVSSGAVTANDITLASDSGSATNTLGETFTLSGGTGLNTSATGSTVTMNVDAAQTGITSLLATDIKIGEDDQTKIDFETADQINFYANNVNVVQLSKDNDGHTVFTVPTSDKDFKINGNDGGSPITALTIDMSANGDASFNRNVIVGGNLIVNGSATQVNTATLTVEDPLISLAKNNDSSDSLDIGFYGLYDTSGSQNLYAGLFRDANDSGKFKLFKDLQAEPTTTVNTSGTGYAVGTLVANLEGNVTGDITGNLTGRFFGNNASSINGDFTFFGTNGNIIFDKSADSLTFQDNVIAKFGTSGDLFIQHDGSNSYITDFGTGGLVIGGNSFINFHKAGSAEKMIYANADGSVELYHDNVKKLETTSGGIEITGTVTDDGATHDGDVTFTGTSGNIVFDKSDDALEFSDSSQIKFGSDFDAFLRHTGSNLELISSTGDIIIADTTGDVRIQGKYGENSIVANNDGSVELYYDNEKKFQTRSNGFAYIDSDVTVEITNQSNQGAIEIGGTNGAFIDLKSPFTDDYDARIQVNSSNLFAIYSDDLHLASKTAETYLDATANGSVNLYYDNLKTFETTADGIKVTAPNLGTSDGDTETVADFHINNGNGSSLRINKIRDGNGSNWNTSATKIQQVIDTTFQGYLQFNGNDNLYGLELGTVGDEKFLRGIYNGAVELYHDNVKKFETTASGAKISGGTGDAVLLLEADTTNTDENDNPRIEYSQDGGGITASHGTDNSNKFFITATSSLGSTRFDMLGGDTTRLYYGTTVKLQTESNGVSISGSSGDTKLFIEADSDNDTEGDNAFLIFKLDGGVETSAIWTGNFGGSNDNSLNLTNAGQFSRGISFGTTATNSGWETATERMRIARDGDITTFGTNGNITFDYSADSLIFDDDVSVFFGTGSDLKIFHNGSNSFIREQGTGNLKLQATNLSLELGDGTLLLDTNDNTNSVQLHDNGELRLRTTDTGIDVICEDSDSGSDNTANIRIIAEGTNEIVTLRSNDGVAEYISRNGDNYGTHIFKAFGTVTPNTVNMLQLTSTGNTSYQDLTLAEDANLIFEGATDNAHETTLTVTDPTADRTITLPDATGTINELLISSGSVSNVSNIEFNSSLITTEFSSYRLVLLNVKVDTDPVNFSMRVGTANSADTGANYWQSNFIYGVFDNNGTSTAAGTQIIEHDNTYFALAYNTGALGTGTGENAHFEINLLNANSTSCYKHIRLNQAIYSYFPVAYGRRIDAAMFASNSALNFLQVFPHVGNIASADYRLYGVK